jgi:hypothetical protein
MTLPKRSRILVGLSLAALVVGGIVAARVIQARLRDSEYPEPPFTPLAKGAPCPLVLAESPDGKDREAYRHYWAERRKSNRWFKERGAYARATPAEKRALDADFNGHHVEARSLAEKVLKEVPESIPGLYVLAGSLAEGEGNLPQALHRIRALRHLLEARGRANPEDADAREWYIRALVRENIILSLMDRRAEELRTVELLEKVCTVELPWKKFFPLVKLERFDEARQAMESTARTGRWPKRSLNSRIIFVNYQRRRGEVYRVGKECVSQPAASAVVWINFHEACLSDFRLDEADQALERCLQLRRDFTRSPYIEQSNLRLARGRIAEAWDALNRAAADRQRKERDQSTLEQDRAEMDRAVAAFLLVLGNAGAAEIRARQAWERPSRHGSSTDKKEYSAFASGILLWTALRSRAEELKETGESAGLLGMEQKRLGLEAWAVRRSLLNLLTDETFLNHALRPYLPESPATEPWLRGALMELLPVGVAAEGRRLARAAEDHPRAVPYFDALEAELCLRRDQPGRALELARQALEGLPAVERLLRGRVAAVAAEAARRDKQMNDCKEFWAQALADFPAAARLLELAIPVQVEHDGSDLARRLARKLLRSPRLRADADGLRLVLESGAGELRFKLFRQGQVVHCSGSVPAGDEDEAVNEAVKLFHARLMSPGFSLTPVQINRLGSTAAGARASEEAEHVLKKVRGN